MRSIAPALGATCGIVVRWAFGLLFVYASADLLYGGAAVLFRALGFELDDLHRAPALARTVKEFWGERWNRTVSAWLAEHVLRPSRAAVRRSSACLRRSRRAQRYMLISCSSPWATSWRS